MQCYVCNDVAVRTRRLCVHVLGDLNIVSVPATRMGIRWIATIVVVVIVVVTKLLLKLTLFLA